MFKLYARLSASIKNPGKLVKTGLPWALLVLWVLLEHGISPELMEIFEVLPLGEA
jgi:hypothetical protein